MKNTGSARVFTIAIGIALSASSATRLDAGSISLGYTGTGQLTFITAPGGAASRTAFPQPSPI